MDEVTEIDEKTGFPRIDCGWCDGMGCGRGSVCWCNEHLAMKEEFQRVFNKQWKEGEEDMDCYHWELAWRFGTKRWAEAEKPVFEFLCKEKRWEKI